LEQCISAGSRVPQTVPRQAIMGNSCTSLGAAADDAGSTFVVQVTGRSVPVRTVRRLGWKPDLPDFRDRVLSLPAEKTASLPSSVDLRKSEALAFEIYDQGNLGSCTANAIGAAFHFEQLRQGLRGFTPSRLFIYYNERSMEGTVEKDNGAYIRDGIKSLNKEGICPESMWPYDIDTFTQKPDEICYKEATLNTCKEYARVPQTMEDMKGCINEGFPFVFGFAVFESFMTHEVATTGIMPMPDEFEGILGGHAVQACGYDDENQWFIVRNSWGEEWGDKGYFYMPYEYISNTQLCSDLWAVRFVDGDEFPCRAKA